MSERTFENILDFNIIQGKKVFKYGHSAYSDSRRVAQKCNYFKADDEDEQVDSDLVSCYNCIFRRWLQESFECKK